MTLFSLLLSVVAAFLLSQGLFGAGGAIAVSASILDLVDGMVARKSGKTSAFGKILDSSVDRVSEFFIFIGLIYFYRDVPLFFWVGSIALLGSFMNSYISSIEREVLDEPTRSFMRRPERVTYLLSALLLAPLVQPYETYMVALPAYGLPVIAALFIIAFFTVLAGIIRMKKLQALLRE